MWAEDSSLSQRAMIRCDHLIREKQISHAVTLSSAAENTLSSMELQYRALHRERNPKTVAAAREWDAQPKIAE